MQIITDGLLVRGVYSTVTLAVYGHTVDKVPIKELQVEVKKESPVRIVPEPEPLVVVPVAEKSPIAKPLGEQNEKEVESPEKIAKTDVESVAGASPLF
jgi:hypothetical protein